MNRTPLRKIRRDLQAYRGRTALVIASVFVGVLSVVTFTTLGQILNHQLDEDIDIGRLAMLRVYLRASTNDPINNDAYLEPLRQLAGVTMVEGSADYQIQWRLIRDTALRNGEIYASTEPFGQIQIEPMQLINGRYPLLGRNELAIERRMAERYDLKVGDTLVLHTRQLIPRTQIYRFQDETWLIVGVVFKPYINLGSKNQNTTLFVNYADAQHIAGFAGLSSIQARFENFKIAQQESRTFRKNISDHTPYSIAFYMLDDPNQNTFITGVERLSRILMIISVVTMVVTSFLVTNVVGIIVTEQRRQIGAMKAIGATRLDILRIYGGLALTYGGLGTLPGVLLGLPFGRYAAEIIAPLVNVFVDTTYLPLLPIVLGIAMGLGIPVLASFFPLLAATRITILDAMTDLGLVSGYGKSQILSITRRLPLSISIRQAFNNIILRRSRLALSTFAICLAVTAFMGMLAIFYSVQGVMHDIRTRLAQEVSLQLGDVGNLTDLQTLLSTEQEEAIRTVEPGVAVELNIQNEDNPDPSTLFVLAVDTQTQLSYMPLIEGTGWTEDSTRQGIVLSEKLADSLGKTVGDTLTLATANQTGTFEVIGIADFPLEIGFMEWHQLADFIGLTLDAPIPNAYWRQAAIGKRDANQDEMSTAYALGADDRLLNYLVPGRDPADHSGVVLTSALAEKLGFEVGQEIVLRVNENEQTYSILQIVNINPVQFNLFAQDLPQELQAQGSALEVIALYWEELAALENLDFRELSPVTTFIDITHPEQGLNTLFETTQASPIYSNQLAFADRIARTISSVGLVFNFASLLLALVGGIGLLTILSISVMERLREIGVLRSVGAGTWAISSQFLLEGLLVGFVAWLAAVPLSYLLSHQLIQFIPFSNIIPFSYPVVVPAIGLISTVFLTIVASLGPAINASRKTVSEILRYQ
ncbi:MAG: ABC transporter permease [Chloroflexi bacterium]|nr:ABC transporter permease [Chloroflexota bacterium]